MEDEYVNKNLINCYYYYYYYYLILQHWVDIHRYILISKLSNQ